MCKSQVSRPCSSTAFRYSPQTRRNGEETNCRKIQITIDWALLKKKKKFNDRIFFFWLNRSSVICPNLEVSPLDKSHRPDWAEHQQPRGSAAACCTETKEEIPADDGQAVFLGYANVRLFVRVGLFIFLPLVEKTADLKINTVDYFYNSDHLKLVGVGGCWVNTSGNLNKMAQISCHLKCPPHFKLT